MELLTSPNTSPVIMPKRPPLSKSLNDPNIATKITKLIINPIGYKSVNPIDENKNENINEINAEKTIETIEKIISSFNLIVYFIPSREFLSISIAFPHSGQ